MSLRSDIDLLVPAFAERVRAVLLELRGQGFSPVLHETLRSKERAQKLVADGKSKARGGLSMHCYGCACDIICGAHGWKCRKAHCPFFEELGAAYERHGLVWGGNWDRDDRAGEDGENDLPHGQAIPLRLQNAVRNMDEADIPTFIHRHLNGQAA